MQLAIERNTSLLVDCPSHFPHATHQYPHPYTRRFDDYAPARAGRRTPSTSRNTTLPRSSGKRVIAMTNLGLSSAGRWASAGSAKSTWGPLSPAALRAAWHPNIQKIREWLEFQIVDHCFTKTWPKLHGLSYGLFFSIGWWFVTQPCLSRCRIVCVRPRSLRLGEWR